MAAGAGQRSRGAHRLNVVAYSAAFVHQSLTDLGLPVNGSDGIFLQVANTNGWTGDFPAMPEAW